MLDNADEVAYDTPSSEDRGVLEPIDGNFW